MSNIFGDETSDGGGSNPSTYDLVQNNIFNQAITNLQNSIAGSTVNLNPIIARLDGLDADQITQNNNIATKLNISTYNTDKAELTAWRGGVDDTFTQFFNEIGAIESLNTTQDNRLLALENNIASGYVTHAEQYTYATSQQVKNDSQDAQISDIYNRLGGTGQTVDLGPLTTRVTALEATDVTMTNAINTKATTSYVDFKANLLQTNIDTKLPIDTYLGDLLNVTNRLNSVETVNLLQTTNINNKLDTSVYNAHITTQTTLDNLQSTRITNLENSYPANKVTLSQPQYNNVQYFVNIQDTFNTDITNAVDLNTARISVLENAIIDPTIAIGNVTNLQSNLTSLQSQITSTSLALNTHINANPSHTAASISNTPIAGLNQTVFNVQNALSTMNGRIDLITVNSTGFTAYGNTLLTNFYVAANNVSIPNNLTVNNYISNDEPAGVIAGNRGQILWNINQNLTRSSDSGFRSLRLNSKFPINATAAGSSDSLRTTWDFSIATNVGGSTSSNYLRINPWRMSYYNPYNLNDVWTIRGPQNSTDTTSQMIVDTNMVLTDSSTFSKSFSSIIGDLALNTTSVNNLNNNMTTLTNTVNTFSNAITTNTNNISANTTQINALSSLVEVDKVALSNSLTTKVISCETIDCKPVINNSGDLNGINFGIVPQGPAAYYTGRVFGVNNEGAIYQRDGYVIGSDSTIFGKQYNISGNVVIDNNRNANFQQLTLPGMVYNGTTWLANDTAFLDNNRNVNGNSVKFTNLLDSAGRTVISNAGEIISRQTITCNNNVGENIAFSVYDIIGNLTTSIRNDGTANIGGLVHDPFTYSLGIRGSFGYPMFISSNNNIENNGSTSNDIVLGRNNILAGPLTAFLGQKTRTVVGYNNIISETRSAVIGSNNNFTESVNGRTVCILGNNWFSSDIWANDTQVAQQGHYVLLGQGSDLSNASCFVTIGNGIRMPTSSSGFPLYARAPNVGIATIPTAQHSVTLTKGASARKYKKDISFIPEGTFSIKDMPDPVVYTLKETNDRETGVIADDVKGAWEGFVYKIDGKPEAFDYARSVVGLFDIIRQLNSSLISMKERIIALENKF